jgi:hypothetical protein
MKVLHAVQKRGGVRSFEEYVFTTWPHSLQSSRSKQEARSKSPDTILVNKLLE